MNLIESANTSLSHVLPGDIVGLVKSRGDSSSSTGMEAKVAYNSWSRELTSAAVFDSLVKPVDSKSMDLQNLKCNPTGSIATKSGGESNSLTDTADKTYERRILIRESSLPVHLVAAPAIPSNCICTGADSKSMDIDSIKNAAAVARIMPGVHYSTTVSVAGPAVGRQVEIAGPSWQTAAIPRVVEELGASLSVSSGMIVKDPPSMQYWPVAVPRSSPERPAWESIANYPMAPFPRRSHEIGLLISKPSSLELTSADRRVLPMDCEVIPKMIPLSVESETASFLSSDNSSECC